MIKIKDSNPCCVYCGKSYKSKTRLDNHILLCEFLKRNKNGSRLDENDNVEIPSQKQMFHLLTELAVKYNKMEQKVDELSKMLVKQRKNMNIADWLKTNVTPSIVFDDLHRCVNITDSDIDYLFNNTFNGTVNQIFTKVSAKSDMVLPIYACDQKPNILYVYDKDSDCDNNLVNDKKTKKNKWKEASKEQLVKFFNRIQRNISIKMLEWKQKNNKIVQENEALTMKYDKAMIKLMEVEFNNVTTLNKMIGIVYLIFKKSLEL